MKVLIACEFSGTVRDAFRDLGYDAWSCDILPSESPRGPHFQCDVLDVLGDGWDLMIAHPPCTHLSGSGARWCVDHWVTKKDHPDGRYWHDGSEKRRQRAESVAFVKALWAAPIERIAIENPVGRLSTLWMKPTQYVEPFEHGHGERKKTGLWLKSLPKLTATNNVPGREQRIWRMAPSDDRGLERSRFFTGIAAAMARQWSEAMQSRKAA